MSARFGANTVDHIYRWLGYFTSLYLIAAAVEFFAHLHAAYPEAERLLDALSEPYLGALATYVVLKELRKRRGVPPLHRGEHFVAAWLILLAVTTLAVAFTATYRFDPVYHLIISNSLASFIIFLGSRIHRP
ncbi:MAG: hypothetical protein HY474_00670 [Candidatus Sungbacteria bacterium]|uniref:Uncharacterized protein n=1 Tax=Candidatus Sungiibacteriota bacterium TaxID=2750080 RepID=A0A932YXK2_9BACT|nr:hypothetical protein [Candidatus Sungbacteria bacterium]